MQFNPNGRLLATEVHGFHTMEDLDIPNTLSEAKSRWLRPNEIHAILSNYTYFTINVKPVNLPKGGTIVLFDRKKLRNFRKDGHNWRKKKDGKTVKEAHEHLKVGTEERIHVYYAHGEDNPTFVRRCYWLLDKALEHIVLVHYRDTQELQGSPVTPVNSDLGSDVSDRSASQLLSGVSDGQAIQVSPTALKEYAECGDSINTTNYQLRLHEINTLDWDELLASNDTNEATLATKEQAPTMQQYRQHACNLENNGNSLLINQSQADMPASKNGIDPLEGSSFAQVSPLSNVLFSTMGGEISQNKEHRSYNTGIAGGGDPLEKGGLQSQDSFGRWINEIIVDSPPIDDPSLESSGVSGHGSFRSSATVNHESSIPAQIFIITDISQSWASSSEDTKILVVGYFHHEYQHLAKSNIFCVCGDTCISAETIQAGVFRCLVPPHNPGSTSLYLSIDRSTPISQVLSFEFRSLMHTNATIKEEKPQWDMFRIQTRLSHLLFSTSKSLDILSSKVSPTALKEGKKFALKYSNIADSWAYFNRLVEDGRISFERAKEGLFELAIKSRLKEWLLERVVDGSKIAERDAQGQGVLHLCAILDYTWVVYPYSACGMSLDFRDKFGWTALHWAAYYGREKMVAALLSAGAKPNLVSDPTPENPGGCTPADIAHKQGFEGLSAYLSEKALVQQFEDMKNAGNVGGSLGTPTEIIRPNNISEEEIYLKDTLTAYRTAADAAARIHVAFRERSLKQRTNDARVDNSEAQARYIVAAMKIQHAFRNYDTRKKMAAAAHIQHRFRAWKLRREFLNMRRQAIKIQSVFRGFQVRRQYRKICWSVGVLEKAILRWRLKRKGFRGLKVEIQEPIQERSPESDTEEDFYRASRQQAEVRVEKAVVRVQAMFRSRQAQQEYRRMKLAHAQAQHEYDESINPYAYLSHM
ncbi:calmodulin-binding transcription activator 5 isoform X1 [Silene latifolia]|uniref:calmodulin-binding transcription activator 5 isoform X1 n=1 Tax=Silene latifolia TaxID=37657 RepID=UPI003D788A8B